MTPHQESVKERHPKTLGTHGGCLKPRPAGRGGGRTRCCSSVCPPASGRISRPWAGKKMRGNLTTFVKLMHFVERKLKSVWIAFGVSAEVTLLCVFFMENFVYNKKKNKNMIGKLFYSLPRQTNICYLIFHSL